jgi:TPP-dependent pyruvate/acetoin dehydrogenase alpha subunit
MKAEVLRETNDATDTAELSPLPAAETLYQNVYEGTHEPWL